MTGSLCLYHHYIGKVTQKGHPTQVVGSLTLQTKIAVQFYAPGSSANGFQRQSRQLVWELVLLSQCPGKWLSEMVQLYIKGLVWKRRFFIQFQSHLHSFLSFQNFLLPLWLCKPVRNSLQLQRMAPMTMLPLTMSLALFFFFFISHMPSQAFITINLHELFFQTLCLDKRIIGFGLWLFYLCTMEDERSSHNPLLA